MRQTDAIAFDFFLPRCGDSISPGVNAFWGKDLLFFFLEGGFKEDLYRDSVPNPAKGHYALWTPLW